jgi:hypothetical protein
MNIETYENELVIRTDIKAGALEEKSNHSEEVAVRTGLVGGREPDNHSEELVSRADATS